MKTLQTFSFLFSLLTNCLSPLWAAPPDPVYPLKISNNKRYLVDQNNVPTMIVGDSSWTLIAKLAPAEAAVYFADRKARGFNTVLVALFCGSDAFGHADFSTFDGIIPFTTPGDISTPNPAYFKRVDDMLRLAANYGLCTFLCPIENYGWETTFEKSGATKCRDFGVYLGKRYKNFPNIVWSHGNDYQDWPAADTAFLNIVNGIRSVDTNHLHTIELHFLNSCSLDDNNWAPVIGINFVYTYFPTYAEEYHAYNLSNAIPVILGEANYEQEHNANTDGGSIENLRRQEYWTALSGTTGQLYGSYWTDRFAPGWKNNLDTLGALQIGYLVALFKPLEWYNLVPDQNHAFVTAGYGTAYTNLTASTASGTILADKYASAAITPEGTLAMVYLPTIRTLTVNMAKLAGSANVRWYDPSNGKYSTIAGSPFPNTGEHKFAPPGNTSDGKGDWVLVFTSAKASASTPSPGQKLRMTP